jgi:hypothetical protein
MGGARARLSGRGSGPEHHPGRARSVPEGTVNGGVSGAFMVATTRGLTWA